MAYTFKKSDAVDFANNIKMMVDALVSEGFEEFEARDFVKQLMIASAGKSTRLF
jgi:hypothetical protein